ncbi:MAG: ABC transporter substrate-binding protein, partial [Bradyrhizobiaceae bacterium]|nr:ABC transporter substrate-binding protein [Bradyrhizobiaceae bacterium]
DEKLNIVPQLALSYDTSADGLSVTIKLRQGVTFHDGEAFDAEAAKYSLDRHLTMTGSFRKSEISAIDHVEVVDPLTIRLVLKTPFSPLIAQLTDRAGMMVAPKAAQEAGDKFGLKPVCAGPYRFVQRVQQDRIVVEKFQDYWNKDNVHIDRIIYLPIVDATVRLANLKSGGLDLIERVLATDVKDVRSDPNLKLSSALELGYQGLTINVGKGDAAKNPLGSDARVRRALEAAIDRDALVQVVSNNEFVAGNQWVNPEHPYYQSDIPVPKRDIAKARALLKEAGVATPIPIDLMVPKGAETQTVAEMIQAMAGEIGFDMKIRVTEFATSLKQAEDGGYQAYVLAWSGRPDPDGNSYSFATCHGALNYSGYCNADVDAALAEARTVTDVAARKAAYARGARQFGADDPLIYLFHRRILIAHTTRLEGYKQMPDGLVRVIGLTLKQ